MENILAHLGGNPFASPVGQKIEQATDASLASENWAINMEICDIINETDEGPKDAIKAIKKRLQQNAGKNYTVVMYTLTVLETCVKNCGKRFHLLVTQKDFIQEMIKLIGPKNDPPTAVQEKVLSLIQTWADAFHGNPDMQGVVQVYNDLKQKGIEFPLTDLDSMAPIHTPQRSVPFQSSPTVATSQPQVLSHPPDVAAHEAATTPVNPASLVASGPITLSYEQMTKLRSELDIVQSNMRVFGEMLSELTPGQGHAVDLQLLDDLQKTCHAMQSRLVELIDKVANEQVTSELLHLNDEMNNLFLRYERFEKKRNAVNKSQPSSPMEQKRVPAEPVSLIDFSEPESTSSDDIQVQLANMSISTGGSGIASTLSQINTVTATNPPIDNKDEFDMFAHSRKANVEVGKKSAYQDNGDHSDLNLANPATNPTHGIELENEEDFKEMERWLQDKPSSTQPESISSSEFDQFLAERSAAAAASASSAQCTPRRQMDKDEKEKPLFAL